MKLFRTILLSIFFVLASVIPSFADDGGAWLTIQANKRWQKAYAFLRLEHRSNNRFGNTEAIFSSIGGGYSFTRWLNADLSYEYWHVNPEVKFHKAVLSGTGTLTRDCLSVSIKEKLEFAVNPVNSATSFTLRSRLRAQYNFPESIFKPYAMAEIFNWSSWIRSLYYAGTELALGIHHRIDLYYLYHLPNGSQPVHILGVGYHFSF